VHQWRLEIRRPSAIARGCALDAVQAHIVCAASHAACALTAFTVQVIHGSELIQGTYLLFNLSYTMSATSVSTQSVMRPCGKY